MASVAIKKGTFSILFLFYIQEIYVCGPVKHKIKKSGLNYQKKFPFNKMNDSYIFCLRCGMSHVAMWNVPYLLQ